MVSARGFQARLEDPFFFFFFSVSSLQEEQSLTSVSALALQEHGVQVMLTGIINSLVKVACSRAKPAAVYWSLA